MQERLEAIGRRIVPITGSRIPVDEWEFVVFDTEELNAFALPGGRVGFYMGILRLMDNDAQIATVMGHEIAPSASPARCSRSGFSTVRRAM